MNLYTSGDIGKLTGVGPWAVGTTFTSENLSKRNKIYRLQCSDCTNI